MSDTALTTYTIPTNSYSYDTPAENGYSAGNTKILSGKYTAAASYELTDGDTLAFTVGELPPGARLVRAYINTDAVLYDASTPVLIEFGTDSDSDFFDSALDFGDTSVTAIEKVYCEPSSSSLTGSGEKVVIKLTADTATKTFATGKYIEWMFEFIVP